MLIEITQKCLENCTHCMISASEYGEHMSQYTYNKSKRIIEKYKPKVIVISGGEPTLHPDFFDWMYELSKILKNIGSYMIINSNGWWINDVEFSDKINKLLSEKTIAYMQISSHKDYYPNYNFIKTNSHKFKLLNDKIKYVENWQGDITNLTYLGRAVNLMKIEETIGNPNCLVSLSRLWQKEQIGINNFSDYLKIMETAGYFCTPYINNHGYINIGTSGKHCTQLFNIFDFSDNDFGDKFIQKSSEYYPCNKCNRLKNINPNVLKSFNNLYNKIKNE